MLSKKFKRLCSHVIATLSSIGLYSISDSADAADLTYGPKYTKDTTVTYKKAKNSIFTANYEEVSASDTCTFTTASNVATSARGTTGYSLPGSTSTGLSGTCTFTCKNGAYFYVDGQRKTSVVMTSGLSDVMALNSGCAYYPTCSAVANATAGEPYYDTNAKGFKCRWTCNEGYSVAGGKDTTTVQNSAVATSSSALSTTACKGRSYDVEFDCTEKGYIKGSDWQQTETTTATYGSSFTIDRECISKVAGLSFESWTADS